MAEQFFSKAIPILKILAALLLIWWFRFFIFIGLGLLGGFIAIIAASYLVFVSIDDLSDGDMRKYLMKKWGFKEEDFTNIFKKDTKVDADTDNDLESDN